MLYETTKHHDEMGRRHLPAAGIDGRPLDCVLAQRMLRHTCEMLFDDIAGSSQKGRNWGCRRTLGRRVYEMGQLK